MKNQEQLVDKQQLAMTASQQLALNEPKKVSEQFILDIKTLSEFLYDESYKHTFTLQR